MGAMFLRAHERRKDGKEHTYWSLVETVRTGDGPRQRTLCYLGELNSSAQARWLKTVEVFNEQGESQQLKLFPSDVEPPANVLPTTDGREIRLRRITEPTSDQKQLLQQLRIPLPDLRFAPKCSADSATA
jgi:hypothetical protein